MPSKNPKPPLSLRLPADLERRLRQRAADVGVPVNVVACRAIEEHLDRCEQPREISR